MARVANVSVDFSANTARFNQNIRTATENVRSSQARMNRATALMQRSFAQVQRSVTGLTASLGGMRGALAAVLGGAGLAALTRQALQAADGIADTSDRLGVAVESLQELRYAAEQSGVATNTFDMALQRFTRRTAEAARGTGAAKDALEQMGIALRDTNGNLRASEDMLGDVADALNQVEDPAERVRLAFQLFDSEGVAMVNMLRDGSAGLEQMRQRARDLGLVMDESLIRNAADFASELSTINQIIRTNFQAGLLQGLIGDGERLSDVFADGEIAEAIEDIATALGNLGRIGLETLPVLVRNFDLLLTAAGALVGMRVGAVFGPWGAAIGLVAGAVVTLNEQFEITKGVVEQAGAASNQYQEYLRQVETAGYAAAQGQRALAIEANRAAKELADAARAAAFADARSANETVMRFLRERDQAPAQLLESDVGFQNAVETQERANAAFEEANRIAAQLAREYAELSAPIEAVGVNLGEARDSAAALGSAIEDAGGGAGEAVDSIEDLAGAFIRAGIDAARMEYEIEQLTENFRELRNNLRDEQRSAFYSGDIERAAELNQALVDLDTSFLAQEAIIRERYAPAMESVRESARSAGGGVRDLVEDVQEAQTALEEIAEQVSGLFERQAIRAFEANTRAGFAGLDGEALNEAEVRLRAITDLARVNVEFLTATSGELAVIRDLYIEQELAIARIAGVQEEQNETAAQFSSVLGQGLKDIITGTDDWQSALSNVLNRLFDIVTELLVIQPLVAALGGGSGGGGILGSLFGGLVGGGIPIAGKKASGGPVEAGKLYQVNERGVELFQPSVPGTIIPHDQIGAPAGGDTFVFAPNFALGVSDTVRAEVMNMRGTFEQWAVGAVASRASRGGSYAGRLRGS